MDAALILDPFGELRPVLKNVRLIPVRRAASLAASFACQLFFQ